jgi:hypothetical protein
MSLCTHRFLKCAWILQCVRSINCSAWCKIQHNLLKRLSHYYSFLWGELKILPQNIAVQSVHWDPTPVSFHEGNITSPLSQGNVFFLFEGSVPTLCYRSLLPVSGAPGSLVPHPLDLITFYPTRLNREGQEKRSKEALENSSGEGL